MKKKKKEKCLCILRQIREIFAILGISFLKLFYFSIFCLLSPKKGFRLHFCRGTFCLILVMRRNIYEKNYKNNMDKNNKNKNYNKYKEEK